MRSQRVIASILFWLLIAIVPTAVHAITVEVSWTNADGTTGFDTLEGAATVNLDSNAPVGAPRAYGPFTIARCSGCGGRARVFVSDGDIDRLILTDAQITNNSSANATLRIRVFSGDLSVSGPEGDYPYAVELSGTFTAPVGQSPLTPAGNQIRLTARACWGESCTRIDSPAVDPGEDGEGPNFSVVVPPYLTGGQASYGPKEQQNIFCSGFFQPAPGGEGSIQSCLPSISMDILVTLRPRHGARLPGSIGTFHVGDRCEPEASPPLLAGCEKMADLFASLGPKGFKVYEVRMEPSPGADRTIDFRFEAQNSPDAWRSHRGGRGDHDDDDHDGGGHGGEGNNTSNTKVRLESNGAGQVTAKGLCPVDGCLPAGTVLPVRLFCGQELRYMTVLRLNDKGDGRTDVIFSLPCSDPGVLIMDPYDNYWVAAPVIQ